MKSQNNRIWCGDFEIVVESEKPYINFLKIISSIIDDVVLMDSFSETWFRENDNEINIRISYQSNNLKHTIWTKVKGDFLNMELLYLVNKQLHLVDYRLEYSYREESVYFINKHEKATLEDQDVVFEKSDSLLQLEFVCYNIIMNLKNEENDFTYEMIGEVVNTIEDYYKANWQKKEFKLFQERVKLDVLPKIDWQKLSEKGINIDKLYEFANKVGE